MRIFDISHPLHHGSPCWPGDTPYRIEWEARLEEGAAANLSSITMSPHVGTHLDAPVHYHREGMCVHQLPLDRLMGPARVASLEGKRVVTAADLKALDLAGVERLLLYTGSCADPRRFYTDYTYLDLEAVAYLGAVGVVLIGVDTHSVDPYESKKLPAHGACSLYDILILENLNLAAVPPGDYELIALPLPLVGAEASPVRAVLREWERVGSGRD